MAKQRSNRGEHGGRRWQGVADRCGRVVDSTMADVEGGVGCLSLFYCHRSGSVDKAPSYQSRLPAKFATRAMSIEIYVIWVAKTARVMASSGSQVAMW
jgi:hypothetical protein